MFAKNKLTEQYSFSLWEVGYGQGKVNIAEKKKNPNQVLIKQW